MAIMSPNDTPVNRAPLRVLVCGQIPVLGLFSLVQLYTEDGGSCRRHESTASLYGHTTADGEFRNHSAKNRDNS